MFVQRALQPVSYTHLDVYKRQEHVLGLARAFCGSARRLPGSLRPFALLAYFAERDAIRGFDRLIPLGSPRRIAQAWKFSLGMG